MEANNKLRSIKEQSERSGISESMLKKLILNREIQRVKIGYKNFISDNVIDSYIDNNTIKVGA